jgi:hypothetical protein
MARSTLHLEGKATVKLEAFVGDGAPLTRIERVDFSKRVIYAG